MKKKLVSDFASLGDQDKTKAEHAHDVGLSHEEFMRIMGLLKRAPNKVELGILGAMWSEHCSYKSTRMHLLTLPTKGADVLVGPGENAGVIDIGDDLAIVFKIESHNHPSFIEPFQGASTGVGGILRDIFTMGARPFALANLLRFGDPRHKKVPHLLHGVVGGIAHYGNCFGVPTVLSNVDFHESYNGNNIVNAFAIGLVNKNDLFLGAATGLKNRVLYVGAKTGRDGIMGAVMASDIFTEEVDQKRPTVQVGDPFTGKLLLEACLMVFKEKLVVGIQDMGAAGLTCATFEMASRASTGLLLNLGNVPLCDDTMSAYDIMLSESQERMLMVAKPAHVPRIKEIFDKFAVDCVDIGFVTGDGIVRIHYKGDEIVNLSALLITENAPSYQRDYAKEISYEQVSLKKHVAIDLAAAIESFKRDLGQRDLAFITNQFDRHIGLNTRVSCGQADAALIKVPNSDKAIALSLLAHGELCKINPFEGARRLVFQTVLEVSAQGACPKGITNCLNFGSPENIEVMTDIKHLIDGMAHAATELNVPIVSGNVSLYNETFGQPILPTSALALVGLTDKPHKHTKFANAKDGDLLLILGDPPDDYAGCEPILGDQAKRIALRPWETKKVLSICEVLRWGVHEEVIKCASVIGRASLLLSLIKIMASSNHGVRLDFGAEYLKSELTLCLLSEASSRVLISVPERNLQLLMKACGKKVPLNCIGSLGGEMFTIQHVGHTIFQESKSALVDCYKQGLGDYVKNF